MKLICLGCSATKHPDPKPMAAIDRYDGPMWRTLRASLEEYPYMGDAFKDGRLRIMALSARYGFIDARTEILPYEERMTPTQAAHIAYGPSYEAQQFSATAWEASHVLLAGGKAYRDIMLKALNPRHAKPGARPLIRLTDGAGIGYQRQQLAKWIAEPW